MVFVPFALFQSATAKMFGPDGLLAHSYVLGPNGQSNGCVSFSDYPDFLDAYLKGEFDRLVVVEHLATAPGPKTASLGGTPTRAQTAQRKTFVLVHGACHGGWCWRRVSDLLEQQGHKLFTPTLTGVGERSHLMSKDINLVGASASTATGTWDNRRRPDCMAGHVRLELRNVVANYPFERSHRFAGIQPNSGHRDCSRLSCGGGETQPGPSARISEDVLTNRP
jgi:Protein of unknown function (DUF2778)